MKTTCFLVAWKSCSKHDIAHLHLYLHILLHNMYISRFIGEICKYDEKYLTKRNINFKYFGIFSSSPGGPSSTPSSWTPWTRAWDRCPGSNRRSSTTFFTTWQHCLGREADLPWILCSTWTSTASEVLEVFKSRLFTNIFFKITHTTAMENPLPTDL